MEQCCREVKAKLEAQKGTEVDKVHHITLRWLENRQQSREERLCSLCEAERFLDAFLRHMLRSRDDQTYMFPPEDAAARKETGNDSEQRPTRLSGQKRCFVVLKQWIQWTVADD